jgi:aspartate racemase
MKKIGILGGISYESTLEYYKKLHTEYFARFHDYYYPEVIIYSLNFQKFTDYEDTGEMEKYCDYILEGLYNLEKAGAEVIAMSANSPHAVFDRVSAHLNAPMISIAECAAQEAKNLGLKNPLLLGIKFTMQASFYPSVFGKHGIRITTPSEEEQNFINSKIFDELCVGIIKRETKQQFLNIISNYEVDGVILGCTEIPLLISQEDTNIQVLNTIELHVKSIIDSAI